MENIAKKEMAEFGSLLKTMSMDDIKQYADLLNVEMEARKALYPIRNSIPIHSNSDGNHGLYLGKI